MSYEVRIPDADGCEYLLVSYSIIESFLLFYSYDFDIHTNFFGHSSTSNWYENGAIHIWKTVTPPFRVPAAAIHSNFKSPSNLPIMSAKTKAELLHQLSILQQKEEELVAMIQGIDSTFQELGYRIDSSTNSANNVSLQTGIRMKGQLSFRGKEKAAEYFDMLDIDKDGYLNYEDFRGK